MNTWPNAIILSIILVAGVWLLVLTPTPTPTPTPIEQQPVKQQPVGASNPIQLYRDVQSLVQFAGQVQKAMQAASRELNLPVATPVWVPEERQVVLYFYDDAQPHQHALQLIQQGHTVYRAGPHREDLRLQFDVQSTPLWLVIREGKVIYRSQRAPRFPSVQPVTQWSQPVAQWSQPPVCVGGTCQ